MGREDNDMTLKIGDDLLLRILSFLPTKEALRTSVLSKRRRNLWTSFSNIDLQESIKLTMQELNHIASVHFPRCRTSFLHFVDRLLLGHDDSDITRFKVSCDVYVDAVCLLSWISAVIKHNVKELNLHFPMTESFILPSCLFSSQSLTNLSIKFSKFKGVFGFPSSISGGCPCLKSLNISGVKFSDDYATKRLFSELSSIFPTLQQLSLDSCDWKNINHMVITSSTLVSFRMVIIDYVLLHCEVVVTAPKLTSFDCKTDCSIGICLAHPSKFADASLEFIRRKDQEILYQRLKRLLFGMRNSKHLTLTTETLFASRGFFKHLPALQNLTYLDVCGCCFGYRTVEEILEFMHKTPNLECLSVSMNLERFSASMCYLANVNMWRINPVPGCAMKKLKKLNVSGEDVAEAEIYLIEYFLENACNLEKIEVHAQKRNAEKLEKVRTGLEALHGTSGNCAIIVYEVKIEGQEVEL